MITFSKPFSLTTTTFSNVVKMLLKILSLSRSLQTFFTLSFIPGFIQRYASAKRGSLSFTSVIFYSGLRAVSLCLQSISMVVVNALVSVSPVATQTSAWIFLWWHRFFLSWSNFPSCWCCCSNKWFARLSSRQMNVIEGSAFLTLVAHLLHTRGESKSPCNTVNPSRSNKEFRKGLSLWQETQKIFSVLTYLAVVLQISSPEVLLDGKFP